jgi:GTP pyrophosphokinase
VSAQSVVRRILDLFGGEEGAAEDLAEGVVIPSERERRKAAPRADPGVIVKGTTDVWVKLARCCTPVPGDEIRGFVTRGSGVSVHRGDCSNVRSLAVEPERMVEVEWAPTAQSLFLVAVQVEALDRTGLLSDITRVLSEQHVNLMSASLTTTRDRIAVSRFTFEMGDPKHLGHVLKAVRTVDGVFDAQRLTQ